MPILTFLGLALRPLLRRPVRTFLLLQGTVWGVAVAVFPSAVIEGTRRAALEHGADLGADRFSVAADPTAHGATDLSREDVVAVERVLEDGGFAPRAVGGARVAALVAGGGAWLQADPSTPRARGLALAAGRWLRPDDPPDAAVVEAGAVAPGRASPLAPGDDLEVGTQEGETVRLHVVGVTAPLPPALRRTNDLGFDVTHPLYARVGRNLLMAIGIPRVDDAWKRSDACVWSLPRSDAVDWIFARVAPERVKDAARVAARALVARDRAPITLHPLVLPIVMGSQVERFDAVRAALFLACLVMGAVVMANLGLLSVMGRSREISVRRVEGATRRTIALQLVIEGVVLSAVGAAVGCALGMGLAALRVALEPVTGFAWVFPWRDGAIACVVAVLVGGLASLLPAVRASRQEPVAGLAEE